MNDLALVDKIESKLKEKREPVIFPLASNHRKELRKLRDDNVGGLQSRLRTIEKLKREEYEKKYAKEIEQELEKHEFLSNQLNKDWKQIIEKINKLVDARKILEEKNDISKLYLDVDYNDFSSLKVFKSKREFSLDRRQKSLEIAREEFEKKYKVNFNAVKKKIDIIVTQYEEAINFGDLEIVKKLYYMMKGADKFFDKISNLKI